jgi:hypothetical protein
MIPPRNQLLFVRLRCVVESGHNREDDLFEFLEVAFDSCQVDRLVRVAVQEALVFENPLLEVFPNLLPEVRLPPRRLSFLGITANNPQWISFLFVPSES